MQQIPAFYFDPAQLHQLAKDRADEFREARPFSHVVIDDFLPDEVIGRLIEEFPGPDDADWTYWGPGRTAGAGAGDKGGISDEAQFGPFIRHFMTQLNSATFLKFVEELSGREGLIPDPSFLGCGLHSTGPGGRLMVHVDPNRHPQLAGSVHQWVNAILYLNPDWPEEYGGHLELWADDGDKPERRILPVANRLLLFKTTSRSWHGHPHPVTCPEGRRRNSLSAYYYLVDRPADEEYEGMQLVVRYRKTTDADRDYAKMAAENAGKLLAALRGQTIPLTGEQVRMLPVDVPPALAAAELVPVTFVDWDAVDRSAFVARHLAAGAADLDLERWRPFALIGCPSTDDVLTATAMTCLVDPDLNLKICPGPESRELAWAGYLDQALFFGGVSPGS